MDSSRRVPADAQTGVPCSIYRGGTSRGVMFLGRDLPPSRQQIAPVLLAIFGSPDSRQIDGLGGGNSQTSKAMIVDGPSSSDHDVQMTFAQVSVNERTVDWGGNCGNMTSAVGPFAIESGLVAAVEPTTIVRIRSVNTGKLVLAHVPVCDGHVVTDGNFAIPGVPGAGARIDLDWRDPAGSVTGRLLPTGHPCDHVRLADGRTLQVSIVDAANPVVFCTASSLELTGLELPSELEARPGVLAALEELRGIVAEMLGIVPSRAEATRVSPGLPKVAVVAPPATYGTSTGVLLGRDSHDLHVRLMSMQTPHRSIAVSGGICTAAAAAIDDTVVRASLTSPAPSERPIRLAHPYGVMDVCLETTTAPDGITIRGARVGRTARRIMSGTAFLRGSLLRDAGRVLSECGSTARD